MTTTTHPAAATETSAATPADLFTALRPDAPAAEVADRVLAATLGAMELSAIHLGDRLGWYRALADHGPLTSVELATETGTVERYAREWLEQQAASGYLRADLDGPAPRFALGAGARETLTDVDSTAYLAPLGRFLAASGRVLDDLVDAYRHGGGVSWERLGADAREAQSAMNRPYFLHALAQESIPAVPELDARLRAGARVADVGCGEGWSAIGVARQHAGVTVDGYDVDAPSVEAARRHAAEADVAERVRFTTTDVATLGAAVAYDVVMAFECVHDMSDPVAVLSAMRTMASPDGYVLVVDERADEAFTAPADPVQRLFYGFSLLCCLPDGLSAEGGVGTGTVMRPSTLARYAREAGFVRLEVLPVEHDMFRFYRLHL
ncbi:methyltransferase domain-containing protein [Actinotalea ferrariae]|uniref:class I SAM-dependent methyltransferase n=1 Tax=Actinotalea ferrariae TaxID=1386098 RepID=UPI001C8B149D|nr:methyltransferase domain-containing protein [Actinotalea ferrariae]MBX9247132.1 methyltransferase domain-containing protein [Actinotalea ferrariae]